MFVQVIHGKTTDPEGLRRQADRWVAELGPGAKGWLGSTEGVTADGEYIAIARFESAEAAAANSSRPEQSAWFAETEKYFSGPVTFHDSTEIDTFLDGGSDRAGFVQVMQGRVGDLARARQLEKEAEPILRQERPDLLGSIRAVYGDGEFTEFAYFTSEADARKGEAKDLPEAARENFEAWQQVLTFERYLDLTDPWLHSPR